MIDRLAVAMLRTDQMGVTEIDHIRRVKSEDWLDARRYAAAALKEIQSWPAVIKS